MKKLISIFVTLLFFASVTVFTLPMMQDDANADLSLTEKVTIMANAGDGGNGDEDPPDSCDAGGSNSTGCGIGITVKGTGYSCNINCDEESYACCYFIVDVPFLKCECFLE